MYHFPRVLIGLSAFGQSFITLYMDFNHTHVLNPRWPPHARFHNGQTMSAGVLLAVLTMYYAYRTTPNSAAAADSLLTSAIVSSVYWLTGLSAILYPGSRGLDPEFGDAFFPQAPAFMVFLAFGWIGWWIGTRKTISINKPTVAPPTALSQSGFMTRWAPSLSIIWACYGLILGLFALISPSGAAQMIGIEVGSGSRCRTEPYVIALGGKYVAIGLIVLTLQYQRMPKAMGIVWLCTVVGGVVDVVLTALWGSWDKSVGHAFGTAVMALIGWKLVS